MRIPIIIGNWKMNTNLPEAINLTNEIISNLSITSGIEIVLCPPFISLHNVKELISGFDIVKLGAQNMFYEPKGAFTGEIAPGMINNLCEYVILGHSERRQYFAEDDEIINRKIKAALNYGIIPIFCIGETLKDNEDNQTEAVIKRQLMKGLSEISSNNKLIIAYEPVWAIGTGKAATGKKANISIGIIRTLLKEFWGEKSANSIRILYGGSVSAGNINEFIKESEIDGALVGGASLKATEFIQIINETAFVKKNG